MIEENVDFPCSPTYLNFYHEAGLTPRWDDSQHRKSLRYWDVKLKLAKDQAESARLNDEAYFADHERDQFVQAQYRKYEDRIEAMERHIDHLQAQLPSQEKDTDVPFRGIPASSAWTDDE